MHWPDEREALEAEVARYRDRSVAERVRAAAQLHEFQRALLADPVRRRRWLRARHVLEGQRRAAFEELRVRLGPGA